MASLLGRHADQAFRFVQAGARAGRRQWAPGGMPMTSGDHTAGTRSGRMPTAGADSGTGQAVAPAAGADAGTGQAVVSAWQVLGPLMGLVTPMALRGAPTRRVPPTH